MQTLTNRFFFICLMLSFMLSIPVAYGKKMYRWYDDEGKVHFTDSIPPEHASHKRESLSAQATVIKQETVEKAESPEILKLKMQLKALRKRQEVVLEQQKKYDLHLKKTFISVENMNQTLSGKMFTFEIKENVLKSNLARLELILHNEKKKAANFERDGKKVPDILLTKINQTETNISTIKLKIGAIHKNKAAEIKAMETKIERYRFLTTRDTQFKTMLREQADINTVTDIGLYSCNEPQSCDQAWELAKQFVEHYSSTPIELTTDVLVLTKAPVKDQDLSLSVSKLTKKNKSPQLFLEIYCRKSKQGKGYCFGAKIEQIRSAFIPFIESKLAPQ